MIRLRRTLLTLLVLVQLPLASMLLFPAQVSAAEEAFCREHLGDNIFFNFPTWYKYLDFSFTNNACDVNFDFNDPEDFVRVGLAGFEIVMRIAGLAAMGFVMFGAFQFLTSQGEPDRIAAGRQTLTNALIGLVVALAAVALVNLIGGNVL